MVNDDPKYNYLEVSIKEPVVDVWLDRPERHNALNNLLIGEMLDFFRTIEGNDCIRVVVLRGKGLSFCAGADLEWMKQSVLLDGNENLEECISLSSFYNTIFDSSKVVIGMVHGNCFGGGVGLAAVCDLVYTTNDASFSLSEARLGLAAASIAPYLLRRIRPGTLKELVFSARRFNGIEAAVIGLVNQSFDHSEAAENHLISLLEQIKGNGPRALVEAKKLINSLADPLKYDSEIKNIPHLLARLRTSDEAREGFSAFLEKRKPMWT